MVSFLLKGVCYLEVSTLPVDLVLDTTEPGVENSAVTTVNVVDRGVNGETAEDESHQEAAAGRGSLPVTAAAATATTAGTGRLLAGAVQLLGKSRKGLSW